MSWVRLGQQSLNGGVDVPSGSDKGLQVGFAVDETHGVELVELLLETNLRRLKLQGEKERMRSETDFCTEVELFLVSEDFL